MKKLAIIILLCLSSLLSKANPIPVADTMRIDGKLVLYLNAMDDYFNGYYYGNFLGNNIKVLFENYMISHIFGGPSGYNTARQIFEQYFTVDERYVQIAKGMIEGMIDLGIDLYSPALNDTLNYKDILIANSVPDFTAFSEKWKNKGPGCSELASWGSATQNDPELNGSMVICRQLDWESDPVLIENALMIVWKNDGYYKQTIITFGFAGLIGALSGVNESGLATFQNMGNYYDFPVGSSFYPVNFAQRNGLEALDYNGDGICSPRDVSDAVSEHNVSSTYIITTVGQNSTEIPAEVLEIHNNLGDTIRTIQQNPDFFGDNLVATNHFRLLKPPAYCYRYKRISDSLMVSNQISVDRNWNIMQTAGVTTNLQTIQFIPEWNILRFSFAEIGTPAYLLPPSEVFIDTLFNYVGIEEIEASNPVRIEVFPNPCTEQTNISIRFEKPANFKCFVTDINGRVVNDFGKTIPDQNETKFTWRTAEIPAGTYFFNLFYHSTVTGKKAIKVKKIVVSR